MAAIAVCGDRGAGRVGLDGNAVIVGVACEIGGMTEGAAAGTVSGGAVAIDPGNLDAGDRGVTKVALTGGAVTMDGGDDVAAMATGAGRNAGNAAVVLD